MDTIPCHADKVSAQKSGLYRVRASRRKPAAWGGAIRITDLQLQEGEQVTAAIPNTAEWFQPAYGTLDETSTAVGRDVYLGDQPRVFENVKNRFYNIVGRGHEAIIVPNVYETDFSRQLTTTVVDITLYAKNDFDLLRISTNYGDYVDDISRRAGTSLKQEIQPRVFL
ncbi:hypothetical protein ABEV21_09890 [Geobacillus stearothermophilus]|uniref:hypothetical protein n=1 Tax=Geobacillus stearothermophilus TaxID=1422 RepID=UPI001E32C994|nr:hypothetical protein [Geobacillus stearothermophilus]MED4881338.1 hypothetical protein [Geobacillus stearothermophilus]